MNNLGVIIKIEGNEAIVMTDECSFNRVKMEDDMFLGQKILIRNEDIKNSGNKHIKHTIAALASIAAIFVMSFFYLRFYYTEEIYAYVDVDINPSYHFKIDRDQRVKAVESLNSDAENVMRGVKFEGMSLIEALTEVIDVSKEHSFIEDRHTNYVLICAALNDNYDKDGKNKISEEKELTDLLQAVRTDLDQIYGNTIKPKTVKVSSEYRIMSKENHISMGRYLVYQKAKGKGIDVSIQDFKSDKLSEILEKNNINFEDLNKEVLGGEEPYLDMSPTTTDTAIVSTTTPVGIFTPTPIQTPLTPISTSTSGMTSTPTRVAPTPTPTISKTPVVNGTGSGLRGEYYDNMDFTIFRTIKVDSNINFEWGEGCPEELAGVDTYSIRWTGEVQPRYSETYTFYTSTDDGVRLWVNNVLLIDEWKSQGITEYSGAINLTAGQKYEIRMEYYEHVRGASAKLMWSSKSQEKEIIPSSQLYHLDKPLPPQPDNGLRAEYFEGVELKNLKLKKTDTAIDFNWPDQPPVGEITGQRYSVRWTGKIQTRYSEEYTFHTFVDDGVRLWIDNVLIIDKWARQKGEMEWSGKIVLKAGRQYDIKIEYFNDGGPASVKLMWSSQRQKKQMVPVLNLYTF